MSGSQAHIAVPSLAPRHPPKWLAGFLRQQPASGVRAASPMLAWARPVWTSQIELRGPRVRRHAHSGSRKGHHYPQHAQLMRVGCVLGTCQVQNLSHRLYQLVGQNGREDSSPINPRSPHSYGWHCWYPNIATASLSMSLFIYLLTYFWYLFYWLDLVHNLYLSHKSLLCSNFFLLIDANSTESLKPPLWVRQPPWEPLPF